MAELQRVPRTANVQDIIKILQQDGCLVIEDLLEPNDLHTLKNDLEFHFKAVPDCQGDFYGYTTKRMSSLFVKSPVCQKLAIDELILAVMDEFLLKGCSTYQINLTQAISIGPGEDAQIIHQDDPMFPFLHEDHEAMINCMYAVDDFTQENGATVLVPGSHLWPRSKIIDPEKMRQPRPDEMVQATMKAGSVLIYFGSLYHGGGQNRDRSETMRNRHQLCARLAQAGGEQLPCIFIG